MIDFIKKNKFSIISAGIFTLLCVLAYLGYKNGTFDSLESFRDYVLSYGPWAFLIFFLANIMQVVVPGVPGGIILAFGVVTFGPLKGFIYNYISICIGSIINFLISKSFGQDLIVKIFGEEQFDKYKDKIKEDSYEKFFAWAILLPVAPDDFLCYITGLSNMTFKKYAKIIFLCKGPSIFLYSMAWYYGLDFIMTKLG
ncbi:TVP38/TMEM64 family protein [Anaerococcus provencensis]|uniref:TVP38/TMEM64 family protein n=1 Tax=Anaerococcus provencensis TaxID=938293 RepID=UPI0002D86169|nr:TVP38/TMEM64 family protein [Anaerococcus provencensis]